MPLFIVGTPIGNLKDITLRAVETLSAADLIACEDTRRSLALLNHLGIRKPLIAYHMHNERECAQKLLTHLEAGKNVALVSDAGMPVISDPGAALISAAQAQGIPVEIIGGVTAFTHALIKSGMGGGSFCFLGFLPAQAKKQREFLAPYKTVPCPLLIYSPPHDLAASLKTLYAELGARRAVLCRELTKLYEEFIPLTLGEPLEGEPRGEYVIVVEGAPPAVNALLTLSASDHLNHYLSLGMDKKEAVKLTARERKVPKDDIYKLLI